MSRPWRPGSHCVTLCLFSLTSNPPQSRIADCSARPIGPGYCDDMIFTGFPQGSPASIYPCYPGSNRDVAHESGQYHGEAVAGPGTGTMRTSVRRKGRSGTGCRAYGPLSDEALSRMSLMPSADIELLGRAIWRLPESEIPDHPSRNWWCQQIIDYVAERAGELNRNSNDADRQPQEPSHVRELCLIDGNAANIRPIQTAASGPGRYEGVSCPRCGAQPGAGCHDLRSARTGKHILNFRPHPERVQAAKSKEKLRRMKRRLLARAGHPAGTSITGNA